MHQEQTLNKVVFFFVSLYRSSLHLYLTDHQIHTMTFVKSIELIQSDSIYSFDYHKLVSVGQ